MPGHSLIKRYMSTHAQRAAPLLRYQDLKIASLQQRSAFTQLERALYAHPKKTDIAKSLSPHAQHIFEHTNKADKSLFQPALLSYKDERLLERQFDALSWRTGYGTTQTLAAYNPSSNNPYYRRPLKIVPSYVDFDDLLDEVTHCDHHLETQLQDALIIAQQSQHYRLWWQLFWVKQRLFDHTWLRFARLRFNVLSVALGLFVAASGLATLIHLPFALPLVTSLTLPWAWLAIGGVVSIIAFHKLQNDHTLMRFWPNHLHTHSLSDELFSKITQRFKRLLRNFGLVPREIPVKPRMEFHLLKLLFNPVRPLLALSQLTYLSLALLIDILCLTSIITPMVYVSMVCKFALHLPFTLLNIGIEATIDFVDLVWDIPKTLFTHVAGLGIIAYQRCKTTRAPDSPTVKHLWHEEVKNYAPCATVSITWQGQWWNLTKGIAMHVIAQSNHHSFKTYYTEVLCKQLKQAPTDIHIDHNGYDYVQLHHKNLPLSSIIVMDACYRLVTGSAPQAFHSLHHLPRLTWLQRVFNTDGKPRYTTQTLPSLLQEQYTSPKEAFKNQFNTRYKNTISTLQYKRHYRKLAKWWESMRARVVLQR